MKLRVIRLAGAVLLFGILAAAPMVHAGGTDSGVNITNQATLNFTVNTVAQTAVPSNVTDFEVDNLVRVVVQEGNTTHTAVSPSALAQVTTFTVTNTGNTTQDYQLASANIATGGTLTLGATNYSDDFNGTGCVHRVENLANAGYQAGEDTAVFIGGLIKDGSKTVYVVCDIPNTATDGQDAIVSLTATTADNGTCATACTLTVADSDGNDATAVEVVFGDVLHVLSGEDGALVTEDAARNGRDRDYDVYRVASAQISVTKTQTVVCDPFNFNVSPYHVPGAFVRYEITISNAGGAGASATLTTLSDALNTDTTFDPDLRTGSAVACATSAPANAVGNGFRLTCTGGTRACATTPEFYTSASDTDAIDLNGATVDTEFGDTPTGNEALETEAGYAPGELKPGESVTIRFNAVID